MGDSKYKKSKYRRFEKMRGSDIIDEVRCSQSAQFKRDFVRLTDSKRVLMKTSKAYEKVSDCLHHSYMNQHKVREQFDEVKELQNRIAGLLDRPDIDEYNDRFDGKTNSKWSFALSTLDELQEMCQTKVLPITFNVDKNFKRC